MPDLQQLLLVPESPVIRTANGRAPSTQEIKEHDSSVDLSSSDVEFQVQAQGKDGGDVCSPPLWKSNRVIKNEIHPLFSHNYRHDKVLKKQETRDIEKSKMDLMDLISSIPESSYELSLKDIVRRDIMQEAEEDILHGKRPGVDIKAGVKNPKTGKMKKSNNLRKLSRNESVNSSTYFLKMFTPTTVSVKNPTKGKGTKTTMRPSSGEGSDPGANKAWWKRFCVTRENIGCLRSGTCAILSHSNSNSNSRASRSDSRHLLPAWWSSFRMKKSNNWCLF